MKLQMVSMLVLAAVAVLSFVPACTEVHNDAPARGSDQAYDQRESTHREESTLNTPEGTIHREHEEQYQH